MKKVLLAILLLPFFAFECKKETTDDFLKGKVVAHLPCSGIVVQFLNNDAMGENDWKDVINNTVYDHVFLVGNQCLLSVTLKDGDLIRFKIDNNPPPGHCAVCQIADYPPTVGYVIKDISVE